MSRRRVLFVDSEPAVRDGLRRTLHGVRASWETVFVDSSRTALRQLAERPFDALVTDLDGPGLDGPELLELARARHPAVARIVLSGRALVSEVLGTIGPAHQFLSKPCAREDLLAALEGACSLQQLVRKEKLNQIVSGLKSLPSQSPVLTDLLGELARSGCSVRRVGRLVASDVALATKVLQLANSAFFGTRQKVSDPSRAVMVVGLEILRALALAQRAFSRFEVAAGRVLSLEALWRHSSNVGNCARFLAGRVRLSEERSSEAFTAGLLHDLGKLILATYRPAEVLLIQKRAEELRTPEWRLEQDYVGASHAELGGHLAGLWGLPEAVTEALTYHHAPWRAPTRHLGVLTLVAVSNRFDRGRPIRPDGRFGRYLAEAGVADRLDNWKEAWKARSAVRVLR